MCVWGGGGGEGKEERERARERNRETESALVGPLIFVLLRSDMH